MKYIFHLVLILLLAFIIAWWYEVYVVRDGQVKRNDLYEETVQNIWWRDAVLSGELDSTRLAKVFWSWSTWNVSMEEDIVNDVEVPLLNVYTVWNIDENVFQWTSSARFQVLEYCTPGIEYCKDAYKQNISDTIATQFASSTYSLQPYITNFWWVDERVWAWLTCVPNGKKWAYIEEVYTTKKLTMDTLGVIGKKMKIDDFETCMRESNIRLQLRSDMKKAKDLFGISSLPTYVVVDTEEGRWVSIPWLYDENAVTELILQEFPLRK